MDNLLLGTQIRVWVFLHLRPLTRGRHSTVFHEPLHPQMLQMNRICTHHMSTLRPSSSRQHTVFHEPLLSQQYQINKRCTLCMSIFLLLYYDTTRTKICSLSQSLVPLGLQNQPPPHFFLMRCHQFIQLVLLSMNQLFAIVYELMKPMKLILIVLTVLILTIVFLLMHFHQFIQLGLLSMNQVFAIVYKLMKPMKLISIVLIVLILLEGNLLKPGNPCCGPTDDD